MNINHKIEVLKIIPSAKCIYDPSDENCHEVAVKYGIYVSEERYMLSAGITENKAWENAYEKIEELLGTYYKYRKHLQENS